MNLDFTSCTFEDGWVGLAERKPSPHCDDRPPGDIPRLLVIHAISLPSGEFPTGHSYIDDLFLNTLDTSAHPEFATLQGVRVSSHFLIRRNASLVQFVSGDQRAWHAGKSEYLGRDRCNDFSIGIELEGSDFVPFEARQYLALAQLSKALLSHYPIDYIVGHQDIAPGRKTDPGPFFDWQYYQQLLELSDGKLPGKVIRR